MIPAMSMSERSVRPATAQLTKRSERHILTRALSPLSTRWPRNPYRSCQSPGKKQTPARTHVPLTAHLSRSFSGGLHFASLPRRHFAPAPQRTRKFRRAAGRELDRQSPRSAHGLDDSFVFVHPLWRESVIGKSFLSFFLLGPDGREVISSFSTMNSATFSLGYAALSPATSSGAWDSAASANTTLVFIFLLLFCP